MKLTKPTVLTGRQDPPYLKRVSNLGRVLTRRTAVKPALRIDAVTRVTLAYPRFQRQGLSDVGVRVLLAQCLL